MGLTVTVSLGLAFLVTAFASVFLMFHLWGYPFDKVTRKSEAPRTLMLIHRMLGWIYLILYIVMMSEMVPRLWEYQVELPPRTVAHLLLGILIGVVLLIKLSIIRFFRHFEEWMPPLGVILLASTIMLSVLSLPFALREYSLASSAVGGGVYSVENRARLAKLLPQAELPAEANLDELTERKSLREGRDVLAGKCVVCHDLKTILVMPRTPAGWWKTVDRMVKKPSFAVPVTERESYQVTAYLIAISGDLQRSAKERKQEEDQRKTAAAGVGQESKPPAGEASSGDLPAFDEAAAASTYERVCSACHGLADVDAKPPQTAEQVKDLIIRMLTENGMEAKKEELDLVYLHMVKKFAGGKLGEPTPADTAPPEPKVVPAVEVAPPVPAVAEPEPTAPDTKAVNKATPKPAAIDGQPLYLKHCKACHAPDGKGTENMQKNNIPDLTDKTWQAAHSKAKVIAAIEQGVEGTKMKSFKEKLTAEELTAVAVYVKKLR